MRNFRKVIAVFILITFVLTTILTQYSTAYAKSDIKPNNLYKASPREIIVKYKNDSKRDTVKASTKKKLKLSTLKMKKRLKKSKSEVLEIGQNDDINKVMKDLKANPEVEYVQPNYVLTTSTFPSDQGFSQQWGLYNSGQVIDGQAGLSGVDINVLQAWDITQGSINSSWGNGQRH